MEAEKAYCCRYCATVLPSAMACSDHAAKRRHLGIGLRLVTDHVPE